MKTISNDLLVHISLPMTTLARLWKVTRVDTTVISFTDHDTDLVYEGVTYTAADGFTPSAVEHKADVSPDNLEVMGFLDSSAIDERDVRARLYDGADIELRVVNYSDLTQGDLKFLKGTLGDVQLINGQFIAQLRGLTQYLTTITGSTYGPVCRAELFDGGTGINTGNHWKCRLNRADYVQSGSVVSSSDPTTISPASGLLQVGSTTPSAPAPAGWFDDGVITFTSGVLDGMKFEIATWTGTLSLFAGNPMPFQPSPGDTFEIEPGCDKLRSTCFGKFNNVVNFSGEADIPGIGLLLQTPVSH